jgi:PKD repeat protein/dienelactone hydrolase
LIALLIVVLLLMTAFPFGYGLGTEGPSQIIDARKDPLPLPTGAGPYNVGYHYENITFSTKNYTTAMKIYYPALTNGSNATANISNEPYPTIVWLPGTCCGPENYADILINMASWGLVVVTLGLDSMDWSHSGNRTDVNELLDHLEYENATSTEFFYKMLDKESFGLAGHSSGGGMALIDAYYVTRIKAVHVLSPAIANSTVESLWAGWHKPLMCQVGSNDEYYINGCRHSFDKLPALNSKIEILGGDHFGPFKNEFIVAFFLMHLRGAKDYWGYFYGEEAVRGSMAGNYDVWFKVTDKIFFPPHLGPLPVDMPVRMMDTPCIFYGNIEGYYLPDDPLSLFAWDFDGDGHDEYTNHSQINTSYIFREPGNYTPVLKYRFGRISVPYYNPTPILTIGNYVPKANAGPDGFVVEGTPYIFNASGTWDSESDIATLRYKWDFGDGSGQDYEPAEFGMVVGHNYEHPGLYGVKLSVLDRHGALDYAYTTVNVTDVPPVVNVGPDRTALEDEQVYFYADATDTNIDMDKLQFRWDFGDGSEPTGWSADPGSKHAYVSQETYTVTAFVKDDSANIATDSLTVKVTNVVPAPAILSPGAGMWLDMDKYIEFDATAWDTESDVGSLEYKWLFGDGASTNFSNSPVTDHRYRWAGNITVTLFVRDDEGASNLTMINIIIENLPPVITSITPAQDQSIIEDQALHFSATATDTVSDRSILRKSWIIEGIEYQGSSANHTFTKRGAYEARFRVTDRYGATTEKAIGVMVENIRPTVTAHVEPQVALEGQKVNFSAMIDDTPSDLTTISVEWIFGDGSTGTLSNLSHTYSKSGNYLVRVVVKDDNNDTDEASFTVRIEQPYVPPKPSKETYKDPLPVEVLLIGLTACGLLLLGAALTKGESPPAPVVQKKSTKGKKKARAGKKVKKS